MKEIVKGEKILINEVEESDIDKWIKKEFKESYPETLVKITFPKNVMDIISSDHHKSKDGGFQISYDFWDDKWFIEHNGYIREVEVEGKSFLEVAQKYISAIKRENAKVLFGEIENEANKALKNNYSIEIEDGIISLFNYEKGCDNLETIAFRDIKGKSAQEIIKIANEILNENQELLT